ncbi:MAG: AIR synthase-related protein [Coriobacteriaceae bacterium]
MSVAIGELADGLDINLDAVPKKYDGLDGTELAISESQERMAVALAPEDVDAFIALAHEENLEATPVAVVTEEPRVRMHWRGDTIVDVSREFLASNGAPKHAAVAVPAPADESFAESACDRAFEATSELTDPVVDAVCDADSLEVSLAALMGDINRASNKGLVERFDSTIGAATVLMPFGGARQLTPALAMVAKLPVLGGKTTTVSGLSWIQPVSFVLRPLCWCLHGRARFRGEAQWPPASSGRTCASPSRVLRELRQDPERWGNHGGGARRAHGPDRFRGGRHRWQGLYVRLLRGLGCAAHACVLRDGHRWHRPRHLAGAEGSGRQPHLGFLRGCAGVERLRDLRRGGAPHRRGHRAGVRKRRLRWLGRDAGEGGRGQRPGYHRGRGH